MQFVLLLLTVMTTLSGFARANVLQGVRVWPSPDDTRVVVDLESEVQYSYFTLANPHRLVVDLKKTSLKARLPVKVTDSKILTQIRKSTPPEQGTYRLVFEMKSRVVPELFKLSPTPGGQYGHRLVIDLPHSPEPAVEASKDKAKVPVSRDVTQLKGNADIIIAIDAGHGGEDPGSIGPTKKYEKHATLSITRKIAEQINQVDGMKAVLTRSGDYFVNLNKRSSIARKNKAHMLVSIHADSFRTPQPRGGSVFVLNTRRANSEIARWVEDHEAQSELLGGAGEVLAKNTRDKNISQTLLDLQFSNSQKEGYKVATNILAEMGKVTRLHKKEPVNASLAVLKSPDIPSVLVETGFISNPTEEQLLFQRSHQDKLARALTKALIKYFEDNPPEGTRFAQRKSLQKHKVERGESLSVIAQRYKVTTGAIMQLNHLKNSALAIGQLLMIPTASAAPAVANSATGHRPLTVQKKAEQITAAQKSEVITHTVKSGEYLGKIASRYKVSVASIKAQNKLKRETLWVGQKLKITVKAEEKPLRVHRVKRGESLTRIARNYAVTIDGIRLVNKLKSDQLAVGQRLLIPHN